MVIGYLKEHCFDVSNITYRGS